MLSWAFPLLDEQARGFVGVLPLPLIFELPEKTTSHLETILKTACIGITGYRLPQDSMVRADTNTHYSIAKSITGCIKFTKRVEFLSPLVRTNSLCKDGQFVFLSLPSRFLERVYILNVRVKIYSTGLQKYS